VDAKVLLAKLARLGVAVTIDHGKLSCRPAALLPPELRREIVAHKCELAALLASKAEETGPDAAPAPQPAEPPASATGAPDAPPADPGYPADAELLLARQLAKSWSDTRAELERLVLSAAERKCWPRIQLDQGVWLLPGKQAWQRYAGNPCTTPDGLVRALEVLHGHPGAG
jgi:hypothetical protein